MIIKVSEVSQKKPPIPHYRNTMQKPSRHHSTLPKWDFGSQSFGTMKMTNTTNTNTTSNNNTMTNTTNMAVNNMNVYQ